jgi:rhamnosyltransferase
MSSIYPPVSVMIRTFNVEAWIQETLATLVTQDYPGEVEILIVDSGSTDGTLAIAAQFPTEILHLPVPFTYGNALNFGDERAQHPLIIHLSADATPAHTDYLRVIVAPLADENVAASFGRDLPRLSAPPSQARDLETWFPAQRHLDPAQRFSNANACIRREVWSQFRFDESLPATEDLEWARRVLNAGYEIVYAHQATAFHTHSSSLGTILRTARIQRAALRVFLPQEAAFSLWAAFRFWVGLSFLDVEYAIKKKFPFWQWFHPWGYRAAQAVGLYQGAHTSQK